MLFRPHSETMCSEKGQRRHVPKGDNTSNAPAVPGNADIRDSEGEGMNLISVSHASAWITMLNASMTNCTFGRWLRDTATNTDDATEICSFGRCKVCFSSLKGVWFNGSGFMNVQPSDSNKARMQRLIQ